MSSNLIPAEFEQNLIAIFNSIRFKQSEDALSVSHFKIEPSIPDFQNDYLMHTINVSAIFEQKSYNEIFKQPSEFFTRLCRYFIVTKMEPTAIEKKRVQLDFALQQVQTCQI